MFLDHGLRLSFVETRKAEHSDLFEELIEEEDENKRGEGKY